MFGRGTIPRPCEKLVSKAGEKRRGWGEGCDNLPAHIPPPGSLPKKTGRARDYSSQERASRSVPAEPRG